MTDLYTRAINALNTLGMEPQPHPMEPPRKKPKVHDDEEDIPGIGEDPELTQSPDQVDLEDEDDFADDEKEELQLESLSDDDADTLKDYDDVPLRFPNFRAIPGRRTDLAFMKIFGYSSRTTFRMEEELPFRAKAWSFSPDSLLNHKPFRLFFPYSD